MAAPTTVLPAPCRLDVIHAQLIRQHVSATGERDRKTGQHPFTATLDRDRPMITPTCSPRSDSSRTMFPSERRSSSPPLPSKSSLRGAARSLAAPSLAAAAIAPIALRTCTSSGVLRQPARPTANSTGTISRGAIFFAEIMWSTRCIAACRYTRAYAQMSREVARAARLRLLNCRS